MKLLFLTKSVKIHLQSFLIYESSFFLISFTLLSKNEILRSSVYPSCDWKALLLPPLSFSALIHHLLPKYAKSDLRCEIRFLRAIDDIAAKTRGICAIFFTTVCKQSVLIKP